MEEMSIVYSIYLYISTIYVYAYQSKSWLNQCSIFSFYPCPAWKRVLPDQTGTAVPKSLVFYRDQIYRFTDQSAEILKRITGGPMQGPGCTDRRVQHDRAAACLPTVDRLLIWNSRQHGMGSALHHAEE